MSEEYDGYRQMVGELSESGFSPSQSEGLVKMFARTFERVRAENKAEHELTRGELREELNRYREEDKGERERIRREDREDHLRLQNRLDSVISAQTRWIIATLCTIILTGIGALVAYVLTNIRTIGLS